MHDERYTHHGERSHGSNGEYFENASHDGYGGYQSANITMATFRYLPLQPSTTQTCTTTHSSLQSSPNDSSPNSNIIEYKFPVQMLSGTKHVGTEYKKLGVDYKRNYFAGMKYGSKWSCFDENCRKLSLCHQGVFHHWNSHLQLREI